jgi:DNA repair photolyase
MYNAIYWPKGAAKEYCELALNIYNGCPHGCTYCYVPDIKNITRKEFNAQATARRDIVKATIMQLRSGSYKGKMIMLCFTCDPYPIGYDTTITREIITQIKAASAHVMILTKGGMQAARDFDLLDNNDLVGVTISGFEASRIEFEPNAAPNKERLNLLYYAKQKGLTTWVSCEPVIDFPPIYSLIKNFNFIDVYKIGKMNHMPFRANWREFGNECIRLCELHKRNYYIKEDLRKELML